MLENSVTVHVRTRRMSISQPRLAKTVEQHNLPLKLASGATTGDRCRTPPDHCPLPGGFCVPVFLVVLAIVAVDWSKQAMCRDCNVRCRVGSCPCPCWPSPWSSLGTDRPVSPPGSVGTQLLSYTFPGKCVRRTTRCAFGFSTRQAAVTAARLNE